jgi:hypothetical protein
MEDLWMAEDAEIEIWVCVNQQAVSEINIGYLSNILFYHFSMAGRVLQLQMLLLLKIKAFQISV